MKKFLLLITLLSYYGIPSVFAVDLSLSTVCHMMWDLGDNSNITFPSSVSALSIYQSGAVLDAPANIWCYDSPQSGDEGQYYAILHASQSDNSPLLNLKNQSHPNSAPLNFVVCGGTKGFKSICVTQNNGTRQFDFKTDTQLLPYLLVAQNKSTDTCNQKGWGTGTHECGYYGQFSYLMMMHIYIAPHQILKPGTYSAPVTLSLKVHMLGKSTMGLSAMIDSDGTSYDDSEANLNLTATISDDCRINRVNDINFGSKPFLDDFHQQLEALQIQCTDGTPYRVTLTGQNKGKNSSDFYMKGATSHQLIRYQMQFKQGSAIASGNPSAQLIGTGLPQDMPIDVTIPPQQSDSLPPPDSYKDIVTAVVTY